MTRFSTITDADLLDYAEGRLSIEDHAIMAARLAREPALAAQCRRVREQTLHIGLLRSILPVEAVPEEWLELLARRPR